MAHGADDGILSGRSARRLTRRDALRLAGLSGLGMALLSACGQQAPAAKPAETAEASRAQAGRRRPPPLRQPPPAAPAAPGASRRPAQAAKPAEAAKPAADAKPAGPPRRTAAPSASTCPPRTRPSLDPYLNVSFRVQEFAAFFYSRLLMSKKAPGIAAQAYIMEGDLAETWKVSEDGKTYTFNLRPDAKWHNVAADERSPGHRRRRRLVVRAVHEGLAEQDRLRHGGRRHRAGRQDGRVQAEGRLRAVRGADRLAAASGSCRRR